MTDGAVPKLLNVSELAERLGISASTVYTWTCRGRLPHVKVGRRVLFDPRTIDAWLAARVQPDLRPADRWRRVRRARGARGAARALAGKPVIQEVEP